MAQSIENSLLEAVKKDDIKAFDGLGEKARSGAYRLGRFPVLSLLYLYKSKKILSAYEDKFIKTTDFEELGEPAVISSEFSAKAGKCLRLYFNETVTPLEMLLILDKIRRLKRVYPLAKPSQSVRLRLQSIYFLKYSLGVRFEGNEIILDRRPLTCREKKNIATACLCTFLAVTVAVGVPVTAVSLIPKPVEGEVTKLSDIDFASRKQYTLKRDISVPENFSVGKVNCKIIGGGNKLIFGKGASFGEFNGTISDVLIESCGDPIFTVVSENATVKSVTVNVSASLSAAESTAFFALANYGTVEGVTVNVSGSLSAVAGSDGVTVGGLVLSNAYKYDLNTGKAVFGTVKNCTVNYSVFTLEGEAGANGALGGVAGENNGELIGCTVSGEITADTVDLAGICVSNGGLLSRNINGTDLIQTSASADWSPNVCGIVYENTGVVEYCENTGKVYAISTFEKTEENDAPACYSAGICGVNLSGFNYYGQIAFCRNGGEVTAQGNGTAFAGGISARSYALIYNCVSDGDITVKAESICAGGILGYSIVYSFGTAGTVQSCISGGRLSVTASGEDPSFVGGITGLVQEYSVQGKYFGGSVTGCYFTGESFAEGVYYGNIVGACGANIYENNSYTYGDKEYDIFKDNYYTVNSYKAFGTTAETGEDENDIFTPVEDKGASAVDEGEIEKLEGYLGILKKLSE